MEEGEEELEDFLSWLIRNIEPVTFLKKFSWLHLFLLSIDVVYGYLYSYFFKN
jgi:hypothetical protein